MKPIRVSYLLVVFVCSCLCATAQWSGIPTGSVKIQNVQSGKYLVGSTPWDVDRRNIAMVSAPERWNLVKEGLYYRISLKNGDEELYAFDKAGYNPKFGKRQVFSWIPGFSDSQGRWDIEEALGHNDMYYLRNVHFDEYLYISCSENEALTRKVSRQSDDNSMFLWKIIKL